MSIACPSGEFLPVALRYDVKFVGLADDESTEFEREPTARFVVRERIAGRDIPLDPWQDEGPLPHLGDGARRLVIVFRTGHQQRVDWAPGFTALGEAIRHARATLARCPALGANAIPEGSPCYFLFSSIAASSRASLADWPVPPVVSEFWYVDAPGDWSMGAYGVRLFKHFDARALTVLDRRTLGAFQAMIDRWRKFDPARLRGYSGPLVCSAWGVDRVR